jgi:hypothetical protein
MDFSQQNELPKAIASKGPAIVRNHDVIDRIGVIESQAKIGKRAD